jgi:hypothetical protein
MRAILAIAAALAVLVPAGELAAQSNGTTEPAPPSSDAAAASKPAPAVLHALLGKEVRSINGERMGTIVNLLVDDAGQLRAAVIDFGGFLGVGVRRIAVDWKALHFDLYQKSARIIADLTRDELKSAAEFKDGEPAFIVGAASPPTPTP